MLDLRTDRPGLAIVGTAITPYHVNLYREIAARIPELQLHILVTHGTAEFSWQIEVPPEFTVAQFSITGDYYLDAFLRRPLSEWRKANRLNRYIRDNRVRAVILNGYRYISFLRVMDGCCRAGLPFFVNADSNIRNEPQLSAIQKFAKRQLYSWWTKRAAGVMPMGTLGDQFFVKYGADPDRLYRVPCWPNFKAFSHVDEVRLARFRQRFGLDQRRHYLLFTGRLVPDKRVDLLIDAFAAIASRRPDWDLLIVGDGALREELHRRVPESLQSRVVWTGFLDRDEPALAYHAANVLVLPSDHEPWALVVQEAMAAGLVVVSSDVSGAAYELIEDRRSGRIFPVGSLEKLTEALLDVTNSQALPNYQRESHAAFARWRNDTDPVAEIRRALSDAGVLSPARQLTNEPQIPSPAAGH